MINPIIMIIIIIIVIINLKMRQFEQTQIENLFQSPFPMLNRSGNIYSTAVDKFSIHILFKVAFVWCFLINLVLV
jgi:hypothetical protein